jgi:hypothetical protein
VASGESTSRNIAWGACIIVVIGAILLLLGAWRFIHAARFGLMDVLYCCLAVIPAMLLLLVFDYVLHHAILVSVIPLLVSLALIVASPAFDVALGLALVGAIAVPALNEWRQERRLRRSVPVHKCEDQERP